MWIYGRIWKNFSRTQWSKLSSKNPEKLMLSMKVKQVNSKGCIFSMWLRSRKKRGIRIVHCLCFDVSNMHVLICVLSLMKNNIIYSAEGFNKLIPEILGKNNIDAYLMLNLFMKWVDAMEIQPCVNIASRSL